MYIRIYISQYAIHKVHTKVVIYTETILKLVGTRRYKILPMMLVYIYIYAK